MTTDGRPLSVAGGTRGGKGERIVHNGEQDAAYGTIALESEAFLLGGLVDYWDAKGMEVPVWAWMNLLAHGTVRRIGECVLRPDKPRRVGRSWRLARSYLAFEVLDLTDMEFTLAELQSSVLIPLELEMAARPDVAGWTPRQWVDLVEDALRNKLWALDQ
jgi:hypothetical protein